MYNSPKLKSSMTGFNRRFDTTKGSSKQEIGQKKISQIATQRDKIMEDREERIQNIDDRIRKSNICLVRVLGEIRDTGIETIFEE